jgi:UDP-N-acetylglucosamine 2-epimerase (non-hydrolysing)
MKNICCIVGTRPNFIKVTQLKKQAELYPQLNVEIVHTGQHYDHKMAEIFFQQFNLEPDHFLNTPSGSANSQIASIMIGLEDLIMKKNPHLILVVGDVNSTLAGALTANKLNIPLAHIESGLRSFDRTMPEEINRILTDELADYYFVTEQSGHTNLIAEGKNPEKIFFTGNTMIDTLVAYDSQIQQSDIIRSLGTEEEEFVLMTMHRPATVDSHQGLLKLYDLLKIISEKYRIVFPVHPRTVARIDNFGLLENYRNLKNLILSEPLDYFSFQKLIKECKFILTDSGGIQEESTFRGKPCLTLRPNTERPSTVTTGTNTLVPFNVEVISSLIIDIEKSTYKKGAIPPFWDGRATSRIIKAIAEDILK